MSTQLCTPDLWIIVDNGGEWEQSKACPDVLYDRVVDPKPIGWLRNRCLELALEQGADYIVFWDDDDYYPPTRVSHAVEMLVSHPEALCAGSSEIYIYFKCFVL